MQPWMTIFGWMLLAFGGLGLWRGATLLLRGGVAARDTTGARSLLVLVEGVGLALAGAAMLLGGTWIHLIWPGGLLMAVGAVGSWLQTRRRRPSHPVPDTDRVDP